MEAISRDASFSPGWLVRARGFENSLVMAEKAICGLALLVMALATAASVLVRNLGLALPNYAELGLAALVPLTLIGGALCSHLGSHISIEIINTVPSRLLRRLAEVASSVCVLLFAALYWRSGLILFDEFWSTGDKLLDLGTPLWILALLFPVGMALLAFHAVMRLLGVIFGGGAGGRA